MKTETEYKFNRGALAMAIGMSLLLTACGSDDGGTTPPAAGVIATPSTITIAENTTGTFDVVLSTEPTADVSISVNSADLSEATTDIASLTFTDSNGISPWDAPQTVTVSGVIDNMADGNQNINVVLGVPTTTDTKYSALAISNVAATVSDIDTAGFTVSAATLSTAENGATVNYTVVLNTMPDGDVVIDVASADISEGTVAPVAITFNAGNWNTPQTVTVTPVDDLIADGNLTYNVSMAVNTGSTTDATGYAALILAPVAVTNNDDDAPGFNVSTTTLSTTENGATVNYTVVLNTMPDGDVVIDVASADLSEGTVAPAALTFTAGNWNTPQIVTVTPVDDLIIDGNLTYNVSMAVNTGSTTDATGYAVLTLAPVAVTNTDDDTAGFSVSTTTLSTTENGATVNYTVVLNSMPDGGVVIDVASADLSEGTVAPAALTFNAVDWNTPQTVTVTPVDDLIADGNLTYNVAMTVNAGSTTDATGYAALTLAPVAVTNTDDDIAGFSVSTTTLSTTENGVTVSYTVVLNSMPDGGVVIDVASADLSEGTVAPAALTFNAVDWNTPQTVTVTPVDDLMADGPQLYDVTMAVDAINSLDTTGYAALTFVPVAVTNTDDDIAGISVSAATLNTTENGVSTSYTVVLNTMPDADVVIDVASANINEGTVAPAALTFTSVDWATPQAVTVTPVDDFMADGPQLYDVTMVVDAVNSLDTTGYAALTLTPVAVTNNDDDVAGLNISVWSVSTIENGANVTYTIALNTEPSGNVVLNLSTLDAVTWGISDEFTVSPATITFTTVDWSTAQTVTVTPLDDLNVDGSVTDYSVTSVDTINTTDSTGYSSLSSNFITVTNDDDDVVEGTLVSPMVLVFGTTDLPKSGGVDTTNSYYEVTGLTAGATYSVSVTGMTDDVGLSVYDDSGQTSFLCSDLNAGTVDKACDATPSGTSLWINVDGSFTAAGATYTLNAVIPPLVPNYSSVNTPFALLDSGSISDTLVATAAPATLTQVEVLINLTHTYDSDLVVILISPAGTSVTLSNANGGSADNYTNTTFSSSAVVSIVDGVAPFSGWYLPQDDIDALLSGEDGNGIWGLQITDTAGTDTGDMLSWGIKLQ